MPAPSLEHFAFAELQTRQLLALGVAHLACDAQLRINAASPSAQEFLGLYGTELCGQMLTDICLPLAGSEAVLHEILAGQREHLIIDQINLEDQSGAPRYLALVVLPQPPGLMIIISDVTVQGVQQQQLQQQHHELYLLHEQVAAQHRQLEQLMQEVQIERETSERLLLNVLPQAIAERLKHDERIIADSFAEVTILFADIVGFTKLAERITPDALVRLLNEVFSSFDQLAERHGLEKIKTIGDAYMVVSGVPTPRADHAQAIAEMALDMRNVMLDFAIKHSERLKIRIGINTGAVVAGVIGTKKFSYDLWGDTVNTASRMESHGIEGAIQLTAATYARLRDHYTFENRGLIDVKGKGMMQTFLLTGRNVDQAGDL